MWIISSCRRERHTNYGPAVHIQLPATSTSRQLRGQASSMNSSISASTHWTGRGRRGFCRLADTQFGRLAFPPGAGTRGYGALHADYIDPIEGAHVMILRISTAIANEFGAFG